MLRVNGCRTFLRSLIMGSVLLGSPMLAAADSRIVIMTFSAAVEDDLAPPDLVLANGMTFMGAAIAAEGQRIIAMPNMDDPDSARSTKMGLMHGTHIFANMPDLREKASGADCAGKGEEPSRPIKVDSVPSGSDELMAGIFCAWKHAPETGWRSSTIYGSDDNFLARVEFVDAAGARKSLYIDVSDWARDILSE